MRINGAVAIVTGASSGIGAATAVEFARRGATVIAVARREIELEVTADRCRDFATGSVALAADLVGAGEPERVVAETLAAHGRVDIVVNNAGATMHRPVVTTSAVDVERLMQINFFAAVHLTMAALPGMVDRGRGSIVNVTSVAGFVPNPNEAAYGATKAALHRWTHGLAVDLRATGIHVGEISPGPIDTDMWSVDDGALSYGGKKFSPDVVASAIATMVENQVAHMTVPRRFGAVGATYPLPLVGRAMRGGMAIFESRGERRRKAKT